MALHHQNWAGNTSFQAARYHEPTSVTELCEIVKQADKVSVIGSRHCFTDIADTTGDLISLGQMPADLVIDRQQHTVTVNAGITYRELCPQLHEAGYALHNMASLNHITVIGACMSATHGSGDKLGNLATAVSGLEIVTADGERLTLNRGDDSFAGAVVSFGALGVVSRVTLDLVPTFGIQQRVYQSMPVENLYANFDAVMGAGYSVSLFPRYQDDVIDSIWVKQQVALGAESFSPDQDFHGASLVDGHYWKNPVDRVFTPMGTVGPWHERLPHFNFIDAAKEGNELQSEYFVAREHAVDAMKKVAELNEGLDPILGVGEIRSVAADDLWLSTAHGHDVIAIHFNWHKMGPEVHGFLPQLEEALAPFEPRTHWGKLSHLSPNDVRTRYPKMTEFQALATTLDPTGKFRNAFVDRWVFGEA